MKFPKDNKIIYSQDFHVHKGVPSGINFASSVDTDGLITLTAPGYGAAGNYGNGSLTIRTGNDESFLRSLNGSLGDIAYQAIRADIKSKVLKAFDE